MRNRPKQSARLRCKRLRVHGRASAFRPRTVTYEKLHFRQNEQDDGSRATDSLAEGRKKVIAHGIESLAEYRDEYAELLEEPDGRRMIEPAIRQAFDSLGARIEITMPRITEVIDSLTAPLEKARKLTDGTRKSASKSARGSYPALGNAHASGQTKMKCDYGYIRPKGVDSGERVDTLRRSVQVRRTSQLEVDRLKHPKKLSRTDEQKVMLGFLTLGDAVAAYRPLRQSALSWGRCACPFRRFRSVRARLGKS